MSYTPPVIEAVTYPAPQSAMASRAISGITDLIIHHTAGALTQTPLDIDAEHRAIGDAGIAYNFVITPDGKIYMGRPAMYVPAATFGRNTESINVVLVGDFQSDDKFYTGEPTEAALDSLKSLAVYLHKLYPSIVRTIGHRDVAPMFYPSDEGDYSTACPGDKLYAHLPDIKAFIQARDKAV